MVRFNFNKALGDELSPFAPNKACNPLAALGASLGLGMFDIYNTQLTNDSNERINNYQIQAQKEMYEDSKKENRFLVDQAYERNLPKNVKKDLLEAGINPAFAMDSGSFGSSSAQVGSAPSAPNIPQAHPAVKSDVAAIMGQGINSYMSQYLVEKQELRADRALDHQIAMDKAENDLKYFDLLDRMHQHGWQNSETAANTSRIMQEFYYNNRTEGERSRGIKLANDALDADIQYKKSVKRYQDILNLFAPDERKKIIRNLDSQNDEIRSAVNKNNADAAESAARKALVDAQKDGVVIENSVADAIVEARVSMAFDEEESAYWNSRNARKEAGSQKYGVGPYTVEQRFADDAANDPNHMRVYHDRKGHAFVFDSKSNKRIYIE